MSSHSAPGINLLSKKKLIFDEQRELVSKAKKGASITLLIYGIILAVVVGLNVYVVSKINGVNLAQEQVKTVLSTNIILVSQYEQIVSKIGMIQKLMNARQEVVNLWQKVQALIPEGCSLVLFSIRGNVLAIGIKSPHVLLTNQALDVIEPALPSLGASKTTVSISRSEDASYRLDLELALKTMTKE